MKATFIYLTVLYAIAAGNLMLLMWRLRNCPRKSEAGPGLAVVKMSTIDFGAGVNFAALAGSEVESRGALGFAHDGASVRAFAGAQTVVLEGGRVLAEAGSITHFYAGSLGRVLQGGFAYLNAGVKAYARNGCVFVDSGARIFNTGCPEVFFGLEPAAVVAEAGAVLYAASGAQVIVEPDVTFVKPQ